MMLGAELEIFQTHKKGLEALISLLYNEDTGRGERLQGVNV